MQETRTRSIEMNFVKSGHLVALFVYCGVAVLVIVNGQSTTDDDIDKDEISRHTVESLRAEFRAELRAEQMKSVDRIAKLEEEITKLQSSTKPDASKFSTLTAHFRFCDLCYELFTIISV